MQEAAQRPRIGLLLAWAVGVSLIVFAVHRPALSARAITFDDDEYLLENHLVQNPSWASVRQFLGEVLEPSTVKGYYQPVAMISLMLDYGLGGRPDQLRPFHRTSVALHWACTLLVLVFLFQLFGDAAAAGMAALAFGVHPLSIESIPWIAERKTLLAAFFAFATLVLYLRYVRSRSWLVYGASIVTCILAMLSKPSATPLPVLLFILDVWPLGRLSRRTLLEKVPFFAVAGAFAVITFVSQTKTYGTTLLYEQSKVGAVLVVCHNIVFYLWKMAWPGELSWYYPYPRPFTMAHPAVLSGAVGTVVLLGLLAWSLRWTRAWALGWLFFFVAVFPTLGVVAFFGLIAADRFVYLPCLGLLMSLAWSLSQWAKFTAPSAASRTSDRAEPQALARANSRKAHSETNWRNRLHRFQLIPYGLLSLWIGCLAYSTHRQLGFWKDSETLNRRMASMVPDAPEPRVGLGIALQSAGKIEEARHEYSEALRIDPTHANAHRVMGVLLTDSGRFDEAIEHFQQALRTEPDDPRAMNNLGGVLAKRERYQEAVQHYEKALAVRRHYPIAHMNLAVALLALGKNQESLTHAQMAARLTPGDFRTHQMLGKLWVQLGRSEEAVGSFEAAVRLQPLDVELRLLLADSLARLGRLDRAAVEFGEAIRLRPEGSSARVGLANVLYLQGKVESAVQEYRRVLQQDARHAAAHSNLAQILMAAGQFEEATRHFEAARLENKDDGMLVYQLAVCLQQLGRLDEAIVHYQEVIRLKPDLVEARNNLGAALADLGRLDEAVVQYEAGLQLKPELTALHLNLAEAWSRLGKKEEAKAKVRDVLRREPDNAEALEKLESLRNADQ